MKYLIEISEQTKPGPLGVPLKNYMARLTMPPSTEQYAVRSCEMKDLFKQVRLLIMADLRIADCRIAMPQSVEGINLEDGP